MLTLAAHILNQYYSQENDQQLLVTFGEIIR